MNEQTQSHSALVSTGVLIYMHTYICIHNIYTNEQAEKRAALASKGVAVFPVILKIIPGNVFNKKNPIILGMDVVEGTLKVYQHTATHCNTLQHTATHCNALRHTHCTATHCNTYCNTL